MTNGGGAQVFEVVSKLVVVTKSATTEEETKRQRLGMQLEALLQKVQHLSSTHMFMEWHQKLLELLNACGIPL